MRQILSEIEGLPASTDPYEPIRRDENITGKKTSLPGEELENELNAITGQQPQNDQAPPSNAEPSNDQAPPSDGAAIPQPKEPQAPPVATPPPAPPKPTWEPFKIDNKKDYCYRRKDGFCLRFRKINSVPNKYYAQIWTDEKILDYGQLIIPPEVNPKEYMLKMADYMLDGSSERFEQDGADQEPAEGLYEPEEGTSDLPGEDIPGEVGEAPPQEAQAPTEEEIAELGLTDEDFSSE